MKIQYQNTEKWGKNQNFKEFDISNIRFYVKNVNITLVSSSLYLLKKYKKTPKLNEIKITISMISKIQNHLLKMNEQIILTCV